MPIISAGSEEEAVSNSLLGRFPLPLPGCAVAFLLGVESAETLALLMFDVRLACQRPTGGGCCISLAWIQLAERSKCPEFHLRVSFAFLRDSAWRFIRSCSSSFTC